MITSKILRKKFLEFFKEHGHKVVSSSSLIPFDSSVLFTTAGMQQFSLYLSGEKNPVKDFGNRHLISCQKCFRSDDIEEVGDDTHNTFFEMLGNWSIGQDENGKYFKEETIKYTLEFLTDKIGLDKNKFYATIFKGNKDIPKDEESEKIWLDFGISKERIIEFSEEDNLWGPVGKIGVCGPNSEIHYDRGKEYGCGRKDCGPNCAYCKRVVEIWNHVFIEYFKDENGNYKFLPQKNVDTGMGFERVASILQNKSSVYETDLFLPIIQEIEKISSKKYSEDEKSFRVIADHLRGAVFLISEGILPSNLAQGYILRRLLRRSIRYAKILNLPENWYFNPMKKILEIYGETYPEILSKDQKIISVIQDEEEKFSEALKKGLKFLKDNIEAYKQFNKSALEEYKQELSFKGGFAFYMYETYGFPPDLTLEELKKDSEIREKINEKEYWDHFNKRMKEHQEISRAGAEKKFKGGLADGSEETKKLHTAAHLLLESLRRVLGDHIYQKGSNINSERLRFDFSHPEKLTDEEKQKVEDLVNEQIQKNLPVNFEEMFLENAKKIGAMGVFDAKYGEKVKVYTIGEGNNIFSREICGGPHIKNTSGLGKFKIKKEQSSGAGVRRIKAVLN